jgi:hypothetical protein
MTGEQGFFQIAVGLIPVLLFGGFLFNGRAGSGLPEKLKLSHGLPLLGVTILGFWAIIAESVAISGAVGGEVNAAGRVAIIAAILVGMLLVVLGAVVPRALEISGRSSRLANVSRWLIVAIVLLFVVSTTLSAIQIDHAIDAGNYAANLRQERKLFTEVQAIKGQISTRSRRVHELNDEIFEIENSLKPVDPAKAEYERVRAGTLRAEGLAEVRAIQQEQSLFLAKEKRARRLLGIE